MLQPIMHILQSQRIVLASSSPRRRQILENIGLKFEVVPSNFEENLDKDGFPHASDYVKATALGKAMEVALRLSTDETPPDLVVGADTVVSMGNKIFEKPKDKENAVEMLSGYSGKTHFVYTGVAMIMPKTGLETTGMQLKEEQGFYIKSFYESTEVHMAEMTPDIIRSYVDTLEPMDKAGGYGIQGAGGTLVKGIKGDYFNIMGFPLYQFAKEVHILYNSINKHSASALT